LGHITLVRVLPKWVKDNRSAVLEEAAPYARMSHAERAEVLAKVVRAGARQLANRPDRARLLELRDPLPKSSRELLARLRKQARNGRGG